MLSHFVDMLESFKTSSFLSLLDFVLFGSKLLKSFSVWISFFSQEKESLVQKLIAQNHTLHILNDKNAWAVDVMPWDWVWWEVNHRWHLPVQQHFPMEPHAVAADIRERAQERHFPHDKEASGCLLLTHMILTLELPSAPWTHAPNPFLVCIY